MVIKLLPPFAHALKYTYRFLSWAFGWPPHGIPKSYNDVIKWNLFPRDWPFVREIHVSPVNSPHKGQWHEALVFSLICTWINVWVNNRQTGEQRRLRANYDRSDLHLKARWFVNGSSCRVCKCCYAYRHITNLHPSSCIDHVHRADGRMLIIHFVYGGVHVIAKLAGSVGAVPLNTLVTKMIYNWSYIHHKYSFRGKHSWTILSSSTVCLLNITFNFNRWNPTNTTVVKKVLQKYILIKFVTKKNNNKKFRNG